MRLDGGKLPEMPVRRRVCAPNLQQNGSPVSIAGQDVRRWSRWRGRSGGEARLLNLEPGCLEPTSFDGTRATRLYRRDMDLRNPSRSELFRLTKFGWGFNPGPALAPGARRSAPCIAAHDFERIPRAIFH